jgi:RNA polymerase sigma-70 factor (ECF subfamily)
MASTTGDAGLKMDVYNALSQLKDVERTCITLQLIDGYPIDKISEITGIPENTVKSHLRRGKEKLTDYLKENGYDR